MLNNISDVVYFELRKLSIVKGFYFNFLKLQKVKLTPCKSFEFIQKKYVSIALDSYDTNIGFHSNSVMDDELLD